MTVVVVRGSVIGLATKVVLPAALIIAVVGRKDRPCLPARTRRQTVGQIETEDTTDSVH